MKLKMNVKTILLFTALFILGTMILGFYSCSGSSTTPVSPQLIDESIVDNPLPGDITTIITEDGDTITITTPTTTTVTEDGTTIVTYIVTIDDYGNVIITPREGLGIASDSAGDIISSLVELELTDFVPDGPLWTGTATITNHSPYLIHYPRVVIGPILMDPIEGLNDDFKIVQFIDVVQDPDIYCGLYQESSIPPAGFPTVFIADEDENYQLEVDGVASHDISIKYEGIPEETFKVFLLYEIEPVALYEIEPVDIINSMGAQTVVPKSIDIEFVECVAGISTINVTLGIDPENWVHRICFVEDTFSQEITSFTLEGFNPDLEPVFTGSIEWNPAVDGPMNITAYFTGEFLNRQHSDSYMDFTTLS